MEEYRTEEEQIEALKRWWNENGKHIIIGVVMAVAAVVGWRWYQDDIQNKRQDASAMYQDIVERDAEYTQLMGSDDQAAKESAELSVVLLIGKLVSKYPETRYAQFARLIRAKIAANNQEFEKAESELRLVMNEQGRTPLDLTVRSRLARLLSAQDRNKDALALLSIPVEGIYSGAFKEIEGDILLRTGEVEKAKEAYLKAKKKFDEHEVRRPFLDVKMSDLGLSEDV